MKRNQVNIVTFYKSDVYLYTYAPLNYRKSKQYFMTREEKLYTIAQNVVLRLFESNSQTQALREADDPDDIFSKAAEEFGLSSFEREAQSKQPPKKKPSFSSRYNAEIQKYASQLSTSDPTLEKKRPELLSKSLEQDPYYGEYFTFDSKGKPKLSTNPSELEKELFWIRDFVESQLQLVNDRDIEKYLKDVLYLEDEIVDRILDLPSEPLSEKEKKFLILNDIIEFNRDEQKLVFSSDPAEKEKQMLKLREFIAVFEYSDSEAISKLGEEPFNLSPFTIKKILKLPLVTASPAAFSKELAKPAEKVLTPSDIGPIVRFIRSQKMNNVSAKAYLRDKQKFTEAQIEQIFNILYRRKEEAEEENAGSIRAIRSKEEQEAQEAGPREYGSAEGLYEPKLEKSSEYVRYPYPTGISVKKIGNQEVIYDKLAREEKVFEERWEWVIGSIMLRYIFNTLRDGGDQEGAKERRYILINNIGAFFNKNPDNYRKILLPNPKDLTEIDYGPLEETLNIQTTVGDTRDLKVISTWKTGWPYHFDILKYFLKQPYFFDSTVAKLTTTKGPNAVPYFKFQVKFSDILDKIDKLKLKSIVYNPNVEKFSSVESEKPLRKKADDDPFSSIRAGIRPLPDETPSEYKRRQDQTIDDIVKKLRYKHFTDRNKAKEYLEKTLGFKKEERPYGLTDRQIDQILDSMNFSEEELNRPKPGLRLRLGPKKQKD